VERTGQKEKRKEGEGEQRGGRRKRRVSDIGRDEKGRGGTN